MQYSANGQEEESNTRETCPKPNVLVDQKKEVRWEERVSNLCYPEEAFRKAKELEAEVAADMEEIAAQRKNKGNNSPKSFPWGERK